MEMSSEQIERERRNGRIAGIVGIAGVVLYAVGYFVEFSTEYRVADGIADGLVAFDGDRSTVLPARIAQLVGLLMWIAPLLTLFSAVRNRSTNFRGSLVGLCIAAPLFFGTAGIASFIAIDGAADAFDPEAVPEGEDPDDAAEDVFLDQTTSSIGSGLQFAGALGFVFVMIYVSLHAMRIGLMTRFWGTLGMALGVGVVFLGPVALIIYFLSISLMVARFWPSGLPPAWDAGKPIPWPKPGEQVVQPAPGEELARPEDFEGEATEVQGERPGRRDNKRKRKRKQRS